MQLQGPRPIVCLAAMLSVAFEGTAYGLFSRLAVGMYVWEMAKIGTQILDFFPTPSLGFSAPFHLSHWTLKHSSIHERLFGSREAM